MNTEPNTTTATELLEKLRQMLDLPTRIAHAATAATRLVKCVNALEFHINTSETELAILRRRCDDLRDDLREALDQRDAYKENTETAQDDLRTLHYLHEEAADEIHDRHPHLLDDLLDYTAHLRHTGADRKHIDLLELTTATLRTISTLIS